MYSIFYSSCPSTAVSLSLLFFFCLLFVFPPAAKHIEEDLSFFFCCCLFTFKWVNYRAQHRHRRSVPTPPLIHQRTCRNKHTTRDIPSQQQRPISSAKERGEKIFFHYIKFILLYTFRFSIYYGCVYNIH